MLPRCRAELFAREELRFAMAQAPTNFPEIVDEKVPSSGDRGALVVGQDGFQWMNSGVVGEAQQRFDWILRSRCCAVRSDAEIVVEVTLRWLRALDPEDRARVGLAWVARWHWLWNSGALEGVDDDDGPMANLVFLVDEDIAELLEGALWWTPREGLPTELLEEMVLWSASALFDRSELWPRAAVVSHVSHAIDAGRPVTKQLIDALELLLTAERRESSQSRREPENQACPLARLLDRVCPIRETRCELGNVRPVFDAPTAATIVRITEALEGIESPSIRDWTWLLLDPLTVNYRDLRRAVLTHLERKAALDAPDIRAALAGARASSLACDATPKNAEILDDLRDALHRPN